MSVKSVLRGLTPPILWHGMSELRRATKRRRGSSSKHGFTYGEEQPPKFYDESYEKAAHWKEHYTESHYYPLWTVIADRIRRAGVERVLDIGCGPGQVACLLRDAGLLEYKGLDFSHARVDRARAVCPEYQFVTEDVFETDLVDTYEYDCVLTMEFLEHVERDLQVLERLRPGTLVLATVPNFEAAGHVRSFDTAEDVKQRYGHLLRELDVVALLANKQGKTYYILEGIR